MYEGLTIAFDLDGTLVETAPDLIAATNHILASRGLGPADAARIRPVISFGARAMLKEGFGMHGHALPDADLDTLYATYLAYYRDNIAVHSHAYPGLEVALDRLAAGGARLAVCTNKNEVSARLLLEKLALLPRFQALAGWDTFEVCKPHPDHLTRTITRAGGDPRRAVMVGDSETDIKTARAARIPVVATTFGYTDKPIATFAPDAIIDHYDDLDRALAASLAAHASRG